MLRITPTIKIEERELEFSFIRSSGPGGQNVNKVATAVQLRFDALSSPSLPTGLGERLIRLAGKRATEEGIIIIDARRFRSQDRNRQDAIDRLIALIRAAAQKPKPRKPTKPTLAARRRQRENKQQRSKIKRLRKPVPPSEE